MSLTPLDERRGDGSTTRRQAQSPPSFRQRVRATLTAVIEAIPGVGAVRPSSDTEKATPVSEETTTPLDCQPVERLPARSQPFTYPTRNRDESNETELVSTETDETITISLPDNPDATLTSDTWEPVEP